MPSSVRTCPHCHALQPPEARFCRACGKPLPPNGDAQVHADVPAPPTAPSSPTSPEVLAYAQSYRQPVTEPLPGLGALAALCFAGGAVAAVVSVICHLAGGITNRLSVTYFFPPIILIPPRMVSAVAQALPQIVTHGRASDSDE